MDEKITIVAKLDVGIAGATRTTEVTVDRQEWEEMTPDQRKEFMAPHVEELVDRHVTTWWEER